jgi:hypothetical protein
MRAAGLLPGQPQHPRAERREHLPLDRDTLAVEDVEVGRLSRR